MRLLVLTVIVLIMMATRTAFAGVELILADSAIAQGGIAPLRVAGVLLDTVTGEFDGRELPFIRTAPDSFYTLLAVDMEKQPGDYAFTVRPVVAGAAVEALGRAIRVLDAGFPVQKLTLPPEKVFPDSANTARIERETALRNGRWKDWSNRPYWNGRFIPPLAGELARFGSRRIINDTPRSPHTGVDITAPEGTLVLAPAGGKVLLTGDFFFTGNSVYIDHGLGMIGMFFHLSEITVAEGQMVEQGQEIGKVGATGRVTGPHLHWGIRWRDTRINPASLLELRLD